MNKSSMIFVVNKMKKLWINEISLISSAVVMACALVFVIMMIVNIRTGFQPPFDPYEALIISSIVFVASISSMLAILLHYRTLCQEPPSRFLKTIATNRIKKACVICHEHPVSKGYHLKKGYIKREILV